MGIWLRAKNVITVKITVDILYICRCLCQEANLNFHSHHNTTYHKHHNQSTVYLHLPLLGTPSHIYHNSMNHQKQLCLRNFASWPVFLLLLQLPLQLHVCDSGTVLRCWIQILVSSGGNNAIWAALSMKLSLSWKPLSLENSFFKMLEGGGAIELSALWTERLTVCWCRGRQ